MYLFDFARRSELLLHSSNKSPLAVEGLLSFQMQSIIDRSTDFVWLCWYASATAVLIYAWNQTNTFRLNGTLIMFNKKVWMVFDTLQVKAMEGLLSFKNENDLFPTQWINFNHQ